jgi:hypothetical protein
MDESVMSGYFGDQEDEEDSFQEYDGKILSWSQTK